MNSNQNHLAIIGSGPVGVEIALAATNAGLKVTLIEKGMDIASNMRLWGHVKLFSNNTLNFSDLGKEVLQEKVASPEIYPTG